ncbi:MAG: HlyC/CorC family transporter [Rickettsiaceae bacterium]|nr:HlyC/CorC family transporter [Rickettsiaceae bacterium]
MNKKHLKNSLNLFGLLNKVKKLIMPNKKDTLGVILPHNEYNGETEQDNFIAANAGNFEDKIAADVMVPRSDISAVSDNISLTALQNIILDNGHTRTLIYSENLDNIIGFIHIKDLFEIIANKRPFNLRSILRQPITCPHSMKLSALLKKMQHSRTHIAVVVDEYGGTDGLLTIENIIEELVGDIADEHDVDSEENTQYKLVKPGVILANARVEIEVIEQLIGFKISTDEEEVDTIGGLVISICGNVPTPGQKILICDEVEAEIIESTPRMIKKLKITHPIL